MYAEDGTSAPEKYAAFAPDLILLDIKMPSMSGFEFARQIRVRDKHTLILFLTSLVRSEHVVEGLAIGANDYIRKEISLEEIDARIRASLRSSTKAKQQALVLTPDTLLNIPGKEVIS